MSKTSRSLMWTGYIFKSKPPVTLGSLGYSFGCIRIDVLETNDPPLQIHGDNRH